MSAGEGVDVACSRCEARVLLPFVEGRTDRVAIAPIEGWTSPPLLCPACSEHIAGHHIDSWVEGPKGGGFSCTCGKEFRSEGYDSPFRNMQAVFDEHVANLAPSFVKGDTP